MLNLVDVSNTFFS